MNLRPTHDRVTRWLRGGSPEVAITIPLWVLDLVILGGASDLTGAILWLCIAASTAIAAGAMLSAWLPLPAVVCVMGGLATHLFVPPQGVGVATYACLIPVMSFVSRRQWRLASAAAISSTTLVLLDAASHAHNRVEMTGACGLWFTLFALAGAMGQSLSAARSTSDTYVDTLLQQQRREIAIDLHDNVAHDLSVIVMKVEEAKLTGAPVSDADLQAIGDMARTSSKYLRQLMGLLQVGTAHGERMLDLAEELGRATSRLRTAGFTVHVDAAADLSKLSMQTSDTLAKVVREATNNIVRHADSSQPCSIRVLADEQDVSVMMSNAITGGGSRHEGLGIRGIRQRLSVMGGKLTIRETKKLWSIQATVPLN